MSHGLAEDVSEQDLAGKRDASGRGGSHGGDRQMDVIQASAGAVAAGENEFRRSSGPLIYMQRLAVEYTYPVYFTRDVLDPDNTALVEAVARLEPARRHRLLVLADSGVLGASPSLPERVAAYAGRHGRRLELVAVDPVPGGEACKNDPALVDRLQRRLAGLHIDRQSFVVGIGGGAMLDLVGYVAATFHRGVRHIRVPTTVLAQNDSGIGVKNGVNHLGIKNLIGTFQPPFAVLNDEAFLDTLEARDRIAGIAEAVKVALIRDAAFFAWLEGAADALRAFEPCATAWMIRRCAELHMRQIVHGGDPFERGSARPLDYGHWSAHKLEALSGHGVRHGEAVAIGMALDARYAVEAGLLQAGEDERVCRLLRRLGLPLWHEALAGSGEAALLAGLEEFREHLGGELTVTLLEAIGRGIEVHEIDRERMLRALAWLERRAGAA
jgi:3-dehydroquinate synthase